MNLAKSLVLKNMGKIGMAGWIPDSSGASVKKCPHFGLTVPKQASFCEECGGEA